MTARPLEQLRVVDCSRGAAGQQAAGLLGDYGASVVWVEPPGGAPTRRHEPVAASVFNRNKRGVVLDLADSGGRAVLLDILGQADVLIEDFTAAEAAAAGLGDLATRHPHLIRCSVGGFGDNGPYGALPAYETLIHAVIGTMAVQVGHRDGPIYHGLPFAGGGAAQLAALGVLAALYRRMDDGIGRHVQTSLMDGAMAFHAMLWGETDAGIAAGMKRLSAKQLEGAAKQRMVNRSFLCGDGTYVGVHTGAVGAFGRLMEVLGLADRIPPSQTGLDLGQPLAPDQAALLESRIHDIFAEHPSAWWVERLMKAEVCCIEHLPPTGVFDQPQAVHNAMVVAVDDPVYGPVEQVAPGIRFDGEAPLQPTPAPRVGEHTAQAPGGLWAKGPSSWSADLPQGRAPDQRPLLDGVKVLDVGAFYAGPYSSRLLADFGAEVIKVEPLLGDPIRGLQSAFFAAQSGKKSLAANLKAEPVAAVLRRLIGWADVIHHNMRPGAAERLGCGLEQVRAINPDVTYLYAPGWGATGPNRLRQSFAPMLSGYVGVTYEVGGQFNAPLASAGNEDPGNGLLGAVAMLISLLHQRRTGRPLACENPQLNAAMGMMAHIVRAQDGTALGAGQVDVLQMGSGALDSLYNTGDGWLCLVAREDIEIAGLERVTGLAILADPRFATLAARRENRDALTDLLQTRFWDRTARDWVAALAEAGVAAVEPIEDAEVRQVFFDPEHLRLGRVVDAPHPTLGKVREFSRLVRVSDAQPAPHRLAPALGEHTDEILGKLGFSADDIAAMRARGDVR
ncbi:MAG: dddD [Caulobacteraceae bacterium]|nr:dddD [Caulobacteraceae bacterium]